MHAWAACVAKKPCMTKGGGVCVAKGACVVKAGVGPCVYPLKLNVFDLIAMI